MRRADSLCVLLSDSPGAERVVPAKVFECMAAKRPILAIIPRGDLWDLLEHYPLAQRHLPGDAEGIAASLAGAIQRHGEGRAEALRGWDVRRYDRRCLTGQLASLLESLQPAM